jgi:DNA-binding response OmpR family regulator
LILLDWWLPGRDGLTVMRSYRKARGKSPVLMITACDAVSDRVRGLDSGADDYLCKPFDFAELVARIRAFVRRGTSAASATTVLEHGAVRRSLKYS